MPALRPRRFLPFAAVVAASALALSACATGDATDVDDTASTSGQTGGELVWAIEGANLSAKHMDPQVSQLDVSAMVQRGVLDSLVFQETDGSFVPWLAESWVVSDDSTSYTFTLRNDVTFHDGEPFNAAAVKANFDRIMDPVTKSAQASTMLGGAFYSATTVDDEFTVTVSFTQPYAAFLQAASTSLLGFYSPKVLETAADELPVGGEGITVGTGPLVLTGYTPDQEIVYTRNDDYAWGPHGTGAVAFETLKVELLPEPAVRAGVLSSGEADLASQISPDQVASLDSGVTVDANAYPGLPYSLFLNEKNGVFADQAVRQAFARALDIDTAVDAVFYGQFPRAWSILGETTPSYDASLEKSWPYDPDEANALLDAAGWTERNAEGVRTKDGVPLTVDWISWTPVPDDRTALFNTFVANLNEVGFDATWRALEPGAYNEAYGPKTFDVTDWGFSGTDPDLLRSHLASTGFQNASQVSDPALDALLNEGVSTVDAAARTAAYTAVQQWNSVHTAIVPLYSPALITGYRDTVEGIEYDSYGRPLFYEVTLAQQ